MRQRRHAALRARERGPENAGAAPALPQGRSHGSQPTQAARRSALPGAPLQRTPRHSTPRGNLTRNTVSCVPDSTLTVPRCARTI